MSKTTLCAWAFFFGLFGGGASVLKAQEEDPKEEIKFIYNLFLSEEELFHSIPMLHKGRYLGNFTTEGTVDQGGLELNNLGAFFRGYSDLNQKTAEELKKAVESATKDLQPSSISHVSTAATPLLAPEVPELNLERFKVCAERSYEILKKIQFLEARKESDLAQLLWAQLDLERGNGTEISAAGTVCGAYLGSLGTAKQKILDELKFVFVAKNLEGGSLKNFLRAFVVVYHDLEVAIDKLVWKHLYLKMALMRVQNPQGEILDLSAMFEKLLDSLPETKVEVEESPIGLRGVSRLKITKVWDKKALQEAFDQGLNYAKKLLP